MQTGDTFHWRKSYDKNRHNRFPSGKYRLLKDDKKRTLNYKFNNPFSNVDSKISTFQAFENKRKMVQTGKIKQNPIEMLKMDTTLLSSESMMWN